MQSEIKRVFKQLLGRGGRLIAPEQEPPPEEDIRTGVLLDAIAGYSNRIGAQQLPGGLSETFLNLNWAREECVQLRETLQELARLPPGDLPAALSPALREAFLRIMRSGELKQQAMADRDARLLEVKRLRRQQRAALLDDISGGRISAPEASRRLHAIGLLEESAKHVLHIAEVIYPEAETAALAVPTTA